MDAELDKVTNNTVNKNRMDGERWDLIDTKELKKNVLLDATVIDKLVNPGKTYGKSFGLSVSSGSKLHGYTIDVGLSLTVTSSFTASSGRLATNTSKNRTHQVQVPYVRGNIYRQVFKVYNKYSGNYLRTVTQTVAIKGSSTCYTVNVSDGPGAFYASNFDGSNLKKFSSFADYRNKVNSSSTMVSSIEF